MYIVYTILYYILLGDYVMYSCIVYTVGLNADIHFWNELSTRGTNPCSWIYRQCKIMIFEIKRQCLF